MNELAVSAYKRDRDVSNKFKTTNISCRLRLKKRNQQTKYKNQNQIMCIKCRTKKNK